jgi:hypothetical protein
MNDHLRAGDADRDRAAALLRLHFAAGRLTPNEFDDRLAAALAAVNFGELRQVLDDLPGTAALGPQEDRLERSYRRLLALYPARHRRVHGDEMLAVLLTAAAEGKTRPGLREAADLIGGAVRVWCQPTRRLGWRGLLAVMGLGAAAGLVGGITVAAASPRPLTGETIVVLQTPFSRGNLASLQAEADVRSQQVLAGAVGAVRPAMSVQALRRDVHVVLVTHRIMQISVHAVIAAQAQSAANAIASSYVAYASKNVPPSDRPRILDSAATEFQPPLSAAITDSGEFGALCGAVLGAILAMATSRPRRRLRMT